MGCFTKRGSWSLIRAVFGTAARTENGLPIQQLGDALPQHGVAIRSAALDPATDRRGLGLFDELRPIPRFEWRPSGLQRRSNFLDSPPEKDRPQ